MEDLLQRLGKRKEKKLPSLAELKEKTGNCREGVCETPKKFSSGSREPCPGSRDPFEIGQWQEKKQEKNGPNGKTFMLLSCSCWNNSESAE
jgi:hypothetical protein